MPLWYKFTVATYNRTQYQKRQIEVIDTIERQVGNNSLNFSTVAPIDDYENDSRLCLTSVHFPKNGLIRKVMEILGPLRDINPGHYYYPEDAFHLTIKNIRVISDPPTFTAEDVLRARKVFESVLPGHRKFKVYFYRLLLFKSNLSLIGTTDEELDSIVLDLDKKLAQAGVPDNKQYTNSRNFFCNMTLARFTSEPTEDFISKVKELSQQVAPFGPYEIDSVTLLSSNAVLKKKNIIDTWQLI